MSDGTRVPVVHASIEGAACETIWKIVSHEIRRRQRDGGQIRPAVQRAVDELRRATQDHLTLQAMFAREHVAGPITNITPESAVVMPVPTRELADRLDVTPTHARRLALKAGIEPVTRNAWRPTDVDELVAQRKSA